MLSWAVDYDVRARLMMFRGPWDDKEWNSYGPNASCCRMGNGHNAYIASHAGDRMM